MKIELDNIYQASKHFDALEKLMQKYGNKEYLVNGLPITEICGMAIYKELLKFEKQAHKYTENSFNGLLTEDRGEAIHDKIMLKLNKIFSNNCQYLGIFINSDPRGYALKIKTDVNNTLKDEGANLNSDWGSYGILAPQF